MGAEHIRFFEFWCLTGDKKRGKLWVRTEREENVLIQDVEESKKAAMEPERRQRYNIRTNEWR